MPHRLQAPALLTAAPPPPMLWCAGVGVHAGAQGQGDAQRHPRVRVGAAEHRGGAPKSSWHCKRHCRVHATAAPLAALLHMAVPHSAHMLNTTLPSLPHPLCRTTSRRTSCCPTSRRCCSCRCTTGTRGARRRVQGQASRRSEDRESGRLGQHQPTLHLLPVAPYQLGLAAR